MKSMKIGVFVLLLIGSNFIRGQAITKEDNLLPTNFSASPNAASLGAYGQIPVNLFNGLPNININLYNIKVDNFEMPLSVSYNLASIKPEEHPGWVGLGWNLNVGGAITRIVKGGVDEIMVSVNTTDPKIFSYYDYYNALNSADWDSAAKLANYRDCMSQFRTSNCAYPVPDEFMFNVNGLSGSFFKNHDGLWVVKANQKLDIKVNEELKYDFKLFEVGNHITNDQLFDIKRIIYGFTLTTDDGIQYVFGKNPNALEFTASMDVQSDGYRPNFIVKTWYLTKIILPSSKEISFEYKTNVTSDDDTVRDVTNKAVFKQYVSSNFMNYTTHFSNGSTSLTQSNASGTPIYKSLERMFVVYLDKITTDDTEIAFNSSLSNDLDYDLSSSRWGEYTIDYRHELGTLYIGLKHWYKLNDFTVKNKIDSEEIYKASFNYLENPTSRLFLTGIEENSATYKKHSFEYNPLALPPYNSQKIDHWGFFNNKNFFSMGIVPGNGSYYTNDQWKTFYPLSRDPNPLVVQAGTLTKIIFPTGGFTQFFYEPHDFSKVVDRTTTAFNLVNATTNNEIAGGLRIRKIVSDPLNSGTPLTKEYFYQRDYKNNVTASSGILSGRPVYIEEASVPNLDFFKLSSNAYSQLNDTNGSHVTYTNVVEKSQDGSFTEYTYSNHDNGFMDKLANRYLFEYYDALGNDLGFPPNDTNNIISKKISFNSLESERGNILSEKKYNNLRNLVEMSNYFYNDDINRFNSTIRSLDYSETVIGTIYESTILGPIINQIKTISKMAAYSIYSHQVYLKKKENILYDLKNNSNTTTTTDYTYSNATDHHHLKSEKIYTSANETLETKYSYPSDPEMVIEPCKIDLIAKHMTGIVLDTQNFTGTGSAAVKLSEQKTVYEKGTTTSNLLLPKYVCAKKGTGTIDPNLDKKITYDQYDTNGSLLQYTPENGTPVTIIWGYNKTQPIAKIENTIYASITPSLITTAQTASNTGGTEASLLAALTALRSALPNAMITTYTYMPLVGVSTITDPKGYTMYYNYDAYGRLITVKDAQGNILSENEYHYKN